MARRPRLCLPGIPLHLIQRGNNRHVCFASTSDFATYAGWLHEYSIKYHVQVHGWVLMTNHVHLLVTPSTLEGVPRMMRDLGQRYVRYFNFSYKRSGTLWEGRYKSSVIEAGKYLLTCLRYIELNPVRAGMVDSPADYYWSSYQANALGKSVKMYTPHPEYLALGQEKSIRQSAYRALFRQHIDVDEIALIRAATNKELVIGCERFRIEIERLSGRRVTELKRGRKPKER